MSGGRRTPPLPAEEEDGGGGRRRQEQIAGGESSRRRAGEASSSRQRSADLIWPEHFVEAVASRIAEEAAAGGRRLEAAPAVVAFFQVCSAWRAISLSEHLWQELTRRVWSQRRRRRFPSWREEFISLHRTAANFRAGRCFHAHINPPISPNLSCRRLAFSDGYLAAGFSDGSVRLHDIPAAGLLALYNLHLHRDRLGHFSTSISGIILLPRQLVFASQDGDIGVAAIDGNFNNVVARRARAGNPVEHGILADFVGDGRRWVGLFAGAPGWSWRVWDGETEQQVYAGGSLTDADSVAGWHMLADISGPSVARVAVADSGVVIGCTSSRVQVVRVDGDVEVLAEMELRRAAAADALGASDGRVVVVDGGRVATVMAGRSLDEVCSFGVVGRRRGGDEGAARSRAVIGCMNWGFVVMWVGGGGGRVWDAATGELLYGFRQRVGEVRAAAASDRYVAAWAEDSGLHLWDFGAGL